jgi:hypothetical protein
MVDNLMFTSYEGSNCLLLVSALVRQFGNCLDILTLQDKYNIRTCSYMYNVLDSAKQTRKPRQRLAVFPVSMTCTDIFYICRQFMYIVYICIVWFPITFERYPNSIMSYNEFKVNESNKPINNHHA